LPLKKGTGDAVRGQQYRTLLGADDAIGTILGALQDTGRLQDTLFLFISDNGWSAGSHRWSGKEAPYEESIRVPLIIRYDPVTQGVARTDTHLALNLDVAQTVASVAGVDAPGAEGASLVPLLDGSPVDGWRTAFLIEHLATTTRDVIPTYCAVRTDTAKYVRYSTGEEELYDLVADPFELQSVQADPAYADLLASMRQSLTQLCSPPPPGYPTP
jgi:arylsulfatase A-like enzyme